MPSLVFSDLLRKKYHFDGVVCTDWGVIDKPYGIEKLSKEERLEMILNSGVDQLGGDNVPAGIVKLVKDGKISEKRIDSSVARLRHLLILLFPSLAPQKEPLAGKPFLIKTARYSFVPQKNNCMRRIGFLLTRDTFAGSSGRIVANSTY